MRVVVQKYGGGCLAVEEGIRTAAERIASTREEGFAVVAVVSARGDTTDLLLREARAFGSPPDRRELDALLATGEQGSAALLAIALRARHVPAVSLSAHQLGIVTDGAFGAAHVRGVDPTRIREELVRGHVVVVTGFLGVDLRGEITTLGRGASDKTAVLLAHALAAERCEVYKDVPAVFTANPHEVKDATAIAALSFDEMLELSRAGAGVLQAEAVTLAKKFDVPLEIRSHETGVCGTRIGMQERSIEQALVAGASLDMTEALVTLRGLPDRPGQMSRIFELVASGRINVDVIVLDVPADTARAQVSFTVPREDLPRAREMAERVIVELGGSDLVVRERIAKIAIIGVGMQSHYGVASRMFQSLADADINIIMVSTSEIKVTCLIEETDGSRGLEAVHRAFDLGATPA